MLLTRRSLLVGLGASLFVAPAIVRASSIMPVKALPPPLDYDAIIDAYWRDPAKAAISYRKDLIAAFEALEKRTVVIKGADARFIRVPC